MGVSKFIYLGPQLVLGHTQVMKRVEKSICANAECKNHHIKYSKELQNKMYCSECGNRITTTEVKELEVLYVNQIIDNVLGDEGVDVFYIPHNGGVDLSENILLPNSSEGRPVDIDLDVRNAQYLPMPTQAEMEADIIWFNETYGKYIKAFNDAGIATEFRYGFMVHFN